MSGSFSCNDQLRFDRAFRDETPLAGLTPDSLTLKEGCDVFLWNHSDTAFVGGTVGEGCCSELAGASYATSDIIIKKNVLISWDRGWDADGQQVWGPESGGYIFKKMMVPYAP